MQLMHYLRPERRFDYRQGHGPISVYQCDECGFFHLTSKGPMNETLKKSLSDGSIDSQKEGRRLGGTTKEKVMLTIMYQPPSHSFFWYPF